MLWDPFHEISVIFLVMAINECGCWAAVVWIGDARSQMSLDRERDVACIWPRNSGLASADFEKDRCSTNNVPKLSASGVKVAVCARGFTGISTAEEFAAHANRDGNASLHSDFLW